MQKKDPWEELEKGKEEDYFLKKHREWVEKRRKAKEGQGPRADSILICPRCGEPLRERIVKEWKLHQCERCGGAWMEEEVLKRVFRILA